jgi:hypothetical protein
MQLSTACVALAGLINLKTLFGLCAPATYRNSIRGGFRVIKEIGINGKFYYPKEDLTATSILIDDIPNLPSTYEPEKSTAMKMRNATIVSEQITAKNGQLITLHFNLKI